MERKLELGKTWYVNKIDLFSEAIFVEVRNVLFFPETGGCSRINDSVETDITIIFKKDGSYDIKDFENDDMADYEVEKIREMIGKLIEGKDEWK